MFKFDHSLPKLNNERPTVLIVSPPHLRPLYNSYAEKIASKVDLKFCSEDINEILGCVKSVHAIIGCPRILFTNEVLSSAKKLVWIHNPGAGVEHFMFPEFVESDIIFTNGKIIQGPECADHAMALLLSLTRRIGHVLRKQTSIPRPLELHNKTAVVIGLGGIGSLIAQRAFAFGMKVIGVDQEYVPMLPFYQSVHMIDQLIDVLPKADVVFMAAPLTGDTENIISYREISAMIKKPFFINVSRGGTVDTNAITEALLEGKLAGAGLDVTNPEPLPLNHPLNSLENVVITPHLAGLSDVNRERSLELTFANIMKFTEGKPLINIVNKKRGY